MLSHYPPISTYISFGRNMLLIAWSEEGIVFSFACERLWGSADNEGSAGLLEQFHSKVPVFFIYAFSQERSSPRTFSRCQQSETFKMQSNPWCKTKIFGKGTEQVTNLLPLSGLPFFFRSWWENGRLLDDGLPPVGCLMSGFDRLECWWRVITTCCFRRLSSGVCVAFCPQPHPNCHQAHLKKETAREFFWSVVAGRRMVDM